METNFSQVLRGWTGPWHQGMRCIGARQVSVIPNMSPTLANAALGRGGQAPVPSIEEFPSALVGILPNKRSDSCNTNCSYV